MKNSNEFFVTQKQTRPSAIVARTRQEINFFFHFLKKNFIHDNRKFAERAFYYLSLQMILPLVRS